ncbi:hypothetical protein MKW92_007744 [Papaver armeniacum]|nr:hypothetical protein MKW92_007744 [Papaver armeniacum]
MHFSSILPNPSTIPMLVTASAELSDIESGRIIHCLGLKDVVSWTALINGYVQNDEFEKGLDCFREMHKVGVGDGEKPNIRTIDGGLKACGNLGYVLSGRCLHGYMVKTGNGYSQFVKSSLLAMYSKCGTTEDAAISLLELDDKDLISMTTIIDPDEIIISCILSGLGKAFHGMIIRRGFKVSKMVINSLISMYSKFGCLNIAGNLFDGLFERDVESWNHMRSGYSKLGLERKCFELFREMLQLRVEANKDSLVLVLSSCSESALIGRSVHCYAIARTLLGKFWIFLCMVAEKKEEFASVL